MVDGYFPVKPGFFPKKREIVYRIAGENSIGNIKKYQNKAPQWSGFTKGSNALSTGFSSGGAVVYVLEADILFQAEYDFFTHLDRNGYKWFKSATYETKIKREIQTYVENKIPRADFSGVQWTYYGYYYLKGEDIDDTDKNKGKTVSKRKGEFIKWFFDMIKSKYTNTKAKETLQKEIADKGSTVYNNDEVVFNRYKIISTYIMTPFTKNEFMEELKYQGGEYNLKRHLIGLLRKGGLPFDGYLSTKDVEKIDNNRGKFITNFAFLPKDSKSIKGK